jgi:hypothetical protein
MKRRLVTILAAISLLLCVGALMFWWRSYSGGDEMQYWNAGHGFDVLSYNGDISVGWGVAKSEQYPPEPGFSASFWPFKRESDYGELGHAPRFLGFGVYRWHRESPGSLQDTREIDLPYWFLAFVFGGFAALQFGAVFLEYRRRRRQRTSLCTACGYDLRATPERCPECGTISATAKA